MVRDFNSFIAKHKMTNVYQPLWNLAEWKVMGYEALLRFPQHANANIEQIFREARAEGYLYQLDTAAIESALSIFSFFQPQSELLFINIYPSTLLNQEFERFLKSLILKYPFIQGQIVFELNEAKEEEAVWDIPELKDKISFLKSMGFYVALDDVGKGAASLQKMIEFSPNYVKLDRYFAEGLAHSPEKQKMIYLFARYCDENTILVLEGIERDMDLAQAILLKVPIAQGYLLGKPEILSLLKPSQKLSPLLSNL